MSDASNSYDQVPYESSAFPETHPEYLSMLGRLFGLSPANPQQCRVLEIGCAAGGNLVPMAFYAPESTFYGIELSALQAQQANVWIDSLGLNNIRVEQRDVMTFDETMGTFDYIVAHGIYSWVPAEVQQKILAICQQHLSPNGLAYISYNVRPGWHVRNVTRDVLLYATKNSEQALEKLDKARQALTFLEHGYSQLESPASAWMQYEVNRLRDASPSYLYHEYLESHNEAILFSDFLQRAQANAMQYVADTDLHTMFPGIYGEAIASLLEDIDDLHEQEQMLDFIRLRPFRQSVLCHQQQEVIREIDLALFDEMALLADLRCDGNANFQSTEEQTYKNASGKEFSVAHPLSKLALQLLERQYPNALSMAEILSVAAQTLKQAPEYLDDQQRDIFYSELFNLLLVRGLRVTTNSTVCRTEVSAMPCANHLALTQAASGSATGPRHRDLSLDAFSMALLKLCDGEHTVAHMREALLSQWQREPALQQLLAVKKISEATALIERNTSRLLAHFAKHGLFVS